jgi:hypothetical protein
MWLQLPETLQVAAVLQTEVAESCLYTQSGETKVNTKYSKSQENSQTGSNSLRKAEPRISWSRGFL